MLRRASVLTIECERLERRFAASPADRISYKELDLYSRLAGNLRRLLDMTGLERRGPKTLIPTIDEYVRKYADDDVMREAAE